MKVSVVMATHNDAATIGDAIRSIQKQTFGEWEMIIIDDGSTDGTASTLDCLASHDGRIRVVHRAQNRGLAAALNEGLRLAAGELIARMDSDDVSLPLRLERQVKYLAAHPEVDVVGTAAELIGKKGEPLGTAVRPPDHEELVGILLKETPFIHPSIMARRRFFEVLGGYDERMRRAQDFDLWWRGAKQFRYANLQEPLIRYRVRRQLPFRAVLFGAYAIFRALRREGRVLRHGWFAMRPIIAAILSRLRMRAARLR